MSRHTITHADEIFVGSPQAGGINSAIRGVEVSPLHQQKILNPPAGDIDGIATAQAVAAPGNLTLDGAFANAAQTLATIVNARNVSIVSSNAGDTTQTATVYGTDIVGNQQVEDIAFNGTTEAVGLKAFGTVNRVAIDASLAGNASVGTSVTLANIEMGLDAGLEAAYDAVHALDGAGAAEGGSFTVADSTSPATAITGDTRGTYNPGNAPDGIVDYVLWYHPILTKDGYGQNFTG
jgi:hypothetical protein